MDRNVYDPPESELKLSGAAEDKRDLTEEELRLKGLGGWLILVGIGVVLGPIRSLLETVPLFYSLFADGTFSLLTDPDSNAYIPFIGAYIIGEVISNSIIILASLYLIYLFFSKHYLFPKFYIGVVVATLAVIFIDAWIGTLFFPNEPLMNEEVAREFIRTLVVAMIWIPYMLVSKRVKLTFVEHRPF